MGFFGKLWALVRGMFITAGDDAVTSSPTAIKAVYATAIDEAKRRYTEMEKAVALIAAERQKTELMLKELDKEEEDLKRKLEGALAAAQAEPGNPLHQEAGTRYLTRIEEIDEKQARLAKDLDAQTVRVEEYKIRLRTFMDEIDRLKREQGEMVAEYVSAQQVVQLEDRLRGLGETAVDESVVAIREKVNQLKARAEVATEMRGATVASQDGAYAQIGKEKLASARFEELLKARSQAAAPADQKRRDLG